MLPFVVFLVCLVTHYTDSRSLKGPNVCDHHEYGLYCCHGFVETADGLCVKQYTARDASVKPRPIEQKSHGPLAAVVKTPVITSKRTVSALPTHSTHNNNEGRPLDIAYSHSGSRQSRLTASEDRITGEPVSDWMVDTKQRPHEADTLGLRQVDKRAQRVSGALYDSAVDMELIRQKASQLVKPRYLQDMGQPVRQQDTLGQSAPQPSPHLNLLTDMYPQVATGRVDKHFYQAVLSGLRNMPDVPSRLETEQGDEEVAQLRQRPTVRIPISNKVAVRAEVTTEENIIYFKEVTAPPALVLDTERTQNAAPRPGSRTPHSGNSDKPESFLSVGKNIKPQAVNNVKGQQANKATDQQARVTTRPRLSPPIDSPAEHPPSTDYRMQRVPERGDGALLCPEGHRLLSSEHGDACVPFDWQPCSNHECKHEEPVLDESAQIAALSDCHLELGSDGPCGTRDKSAQVVSSGCWNTDCPPIQEVQGCLSSDCASQSVECVPSISCQQNGHGLGCSSNSCQHEGQVISTNACLNGGSLLGQFCSCSEGFQGEQCEQDIDECHGAHHGCSHGCLNTVGGYSCSCPPGAVLDKDGYTCLFTACPKCLHGGYCNPQSNQCQCPAGFTGQICETDVDECQKTPCAHQCRNIFGSYACLCRPGYTLLDDGHTCKDWRCKPACVNGGVCRNNRCHCPAGFSGIICQFNNHLR